LCKAAEPLAIVHEKSGEQRGKKLLELMNSPKKIWRKGWRWIRDRNRYAGGGEARFFFGRDSVILDRQDIVVEVPHINHPDLIILAERLKPDVIAVFGTSLIHSSILDKGRSAARYILLIWESIREISLHIYAPKCTRGMMNSCYSGELYAMGQKFMQNAWND
jgi:hypothetical protein